MERREEVSCLSLQGSDGAIRTPAGTLCVWSVAALWPASQVWVSLEGPFEERPSAKDFMSC